MAFLPQNKVREICQQTGWRFQQDYLFHRDIWSAKYFDSRGRILCQHIHKNMHRAMHYATAQAWSLWETKQAQATSQMGPLNEE